jgi:stage V sporulation protein G
MEITEVRIKLVQNGNERLRAFCSVTLDGDFVIRDLKVIDGASGPFVAMPSRKLMDRCQRCGSKNHLRARFCNECGVKLNESRAPKDAQGRAKLHADVAHPINAACRERVQKAVVEAYQAEIEAAKSPDYKPASIDDFDDYDADYGTESSGPSSSRRPVQEEEAPKAPSGKGNTFGDYNELVEDLKRQAEQRRSEHRASRSTGWKPAEQAEEPSFFEQPEPAEQEDAEPAPQQPEPPPPPPKPESGGKDDFGLGL